MDLQGKIIAALPVKTGTSSRGEWKVQEFVLETLDDRFSRKMVFSVFGEDRLQRFNIQVGQTVNVSFDIDAHEYQGRWFNSIRAYDVRPVMDNMQQPMAPQGQDMPAPAASFNQPQSAPFPQAPAAPATPQPQADPFAGGGDSDDLPF